MKLRLFRHKGFSLVEAMVAAGVMAVVITGGLVALGQATLLSGKSRAQAEADFFLRGEIEHIRSLDWSEVAAIQDQSAFTTLPAEAVFTDVVEVTARRSGQRIFRLSLSWTDAAGHSHEEARVFIVTEGGLSAG